MSAEAGTTETGPEIRFEDIHTGWASTGEGEKDGAADRSEALAGLSLTLQAGQITVLLGDHQSGKSLLAMHLLGMAPPGSGRVMVADQSVWDLPDEQRAELKKLFGVMRGGPVMRETESDPTLSVAENILKGLRQVPDADHTEEGARKFLSAFDLDQFEQMLPRDLGPGARRRLAIATALAYDPKVVVIDDPGQALDSEHLDQMIDTIKSWQQRTHATMLFCIRSLQVARDLGDHLAVLRGGKVAEEGVPTEVLDGVVDDDTFEDRFDTGLGGYAEADPERSRLGRAKDNSAANRKGRVLVIVFLIMVVLVLIAMLFGGIRDRNALHGSVRLPSESISNAA